jgi:HlyD family secretion protein
VADGKVRFAPIKTGLTGELDIEVENGLKTGETVISGPFKTLRTIKEGDRVKEMSEEKRKAMESGAAGTS